MAIVSNPREIVFLALLSSLKGDDFISDTLDRWKRHENPTTRDYNFAQEIGYGTARLALALDYIGANLTPNKKLNLKTREKVLLRMAIYQYIYMDRVPIYAITNETITIAKKYCHESFVKFLNAILRKLSEGTHPLPQGDSLSNLSIRYSFPTYFVEELIKDHGLEKTKAILEIQNTQAPVMYRSRMTKSVETLKDHSQLHEIAQSSEYYIQNATPCALVDALCNQMTPPKKVLDLCASPGGKLIAIHDHYPSARLYGNDVSPEKVERLSENCTKYGIEATLSCIRGENYQAEKDFDVIILDVPCSNSGVLNKRPEARWRLSPQNLVDLEKLQLSLISNAASLLSKEGELWYFTCSIMTKENEAIIEKACKQLNLKIRKKETILPNADGWDGGFACALQKL
jgi:16S rRNA (cytosine967-C5)-methyltransferase